MKDKIKRWLPASGVLFLILVFAFVIRMYHLTLLPVFADEAIYIRWSQVMGAEPTLRFLPLSDGKQPLFMWVLMFIVRRFSDPLFISRLLSVVCGIGTTVGIFTLSSVLFKSKKMALIASLLWAVCPIAFFFDRMALVDSMLTMFGVWTLIFAVLTAKLKRLDTALIGGFMLGFALLTKSPAIFFVILLPSTWLFAKDKMHLIKLIGLSVVTLVIGYGMYNILRLGPNFNLIGSRNLDYVLPISHLWTNPKDPLIFHIAEIFTDWFIKMGPSIGLMLGFIGIVVGLKKYFKETVVIFAWFFVPLMIQSEYAKVFTLRYVLMTVPFFVILCSLAFVQTKLKVLKPVALLLTAIFVIQALLFDKILVTNPVLANLPSSERSGYLEEWTAGTGIKEVSEYIKKQYAMNPTKQIVVGTEGYFGTLPDGLQMYLDNYPKIITIGTGLNFGDVPQSLKDSKKAGNATYFVVRTSRIKIKPEEYDKFGLKLLASYPKALRREHESREYVMYGPQESLLFVEVVVKSKI